MFTETGDELDTVIDERLGRLAQFEDLADRIEREAARIARALRPPALPEHGSIDDALKLISALSYTRAADSGRSRDVLSRLLTTALKLAFDHAAAEGATYEEMGEASGKAASNVHKFRHGSHAAA